MICWYLIKSALLGQTNIHDLLPGVTVSYVNLEGHCVYCRCKADVPQQI